ncbi:hypothetical protein [Cellulomonas sp. KRMCY2]|uniref:hypothetical protein n=1 Tax=Cellulomonas sp. KRMCY2 TaxID=1304865 RepID=UPI00045EAB5B|nr:hypothetical protein [Cellulomonas sp. KRMCY2]
MSEIILVLTEATLTAVDVEHITALHDGDGIRYHVLVPADAQHNMLVSLIDHLSLGELREALDAVLRREPKPVRAHANAQEHLAATVAVFTAAGLTADGAVVADNPLPALRAAVADKDVREIVVVTLPHALEDTFHTDWASRAREELKVPVLHLYSGTNQLG